MEQSLTIIIGVVSLILMCVAFCFRKKVKNFKHYGYLGIFLACLIGNITPFTPVAPVVSIVAGRFYNIWLVGFMAALGCVLGEILTYNIFAVAGETSIQHEHWYLRTKQFMEANGFLTIVAVTSIPNPFLNIGAVAAGATKYSFWPFLLASFLGNWIQYSLVAFFGSLTKKIKF